MDISQAKCPECGQPMRITRAHCRRCQVSLEADLEVSPLARLALHDQLFVTAFVRHHGSLKRMEELFDISYPTVKNRLNAIALELDQRFAVPAPRASILDQIARGEITVDDALGRLD
jgi:hypothetical protein